MIMTASSCKYSDTFLSKLDQEMNEYGLQSKIDTVLVKSPLFKHSSSLVRERLSAIYITGEYADLFFHCLGGTVASHKVVLAGLSDHLKNLFLLYGQEEVHIHLPEIRIREMEEFIKKVYIGGELVVENFKDVVHILRVFVACEQVVIKEPKVEMLKLDKPVDVDIVSSLDIFPCLKGDTSEKRTPSNGIDHDLDHHDSEGQCDNYDPAWSPKRKTSLKQINTSSPPVSKLKPIVKQNNTSSPPVGKRKPSVIWKYFQKTHQLITCNTCNAQFKNHGNTTNASCHLKKHPKQFKQFREDVRKQIEEKKEKMALQKDIPEPEHKENLTEDGSKTSRAKRSAIWEHFETVRDPENRLRGECNYCGQLMSSTGGSTSAMISHLKRKHPEHTDEYVTKTLDPEGAKQIWKHFRFNNETAACTLCQEEFNATDVTKPEILIHFQAKHSELYDQIVKESDENVGDRNPDDNNSANTDLIKFLVKAGSLPLKKKRGRKLKLSSLSNNPEPRTCADCEKVFSTRGAMLYHHRVVHSNIKPFACEFCGKAFARKDSYDGHIAQHEAVLPFMCCHCGKTFVRRHRRDVHERSHTGDFRFSCDYCPKQFTCKQKKVEHTRVHTGEKPFQCSNCGRQFAKQNQLVTHFRIHTGEKPYHCHKCVQNFRHLSSYRNHRCVQPVNQEEQDQKLLNPSA